MYNLVKYEDTFKIISQGNLNEMFYMLDKMDNNKDTYLILLEDKILYTNNKKLKDNIGKSLKEFIIEYLTI